MKRALCLGLALLAAGASGCRNLNSWQKTTFLYFDTVCEVQLYCSTPTYAKARGALGQIFEDTTRLFSPGSREFSAPLTLDLFAQAREVFLRSQGCFDLSVGTLSDLWGFHTGGYRVPADEEIHSALLNVGMEKIRALPDRLEIPGGMEMDWGAIAKGAGVDRAARALIELGVARGFINAGGDLFCWGTNPQGRPWQIGVKHPRGEGYLGVLSLSGLGAATTGDYQRFFVQDGSRYHHVLDPRTGRPARGKQSVTVVGPETGLCDALSTAMFVSESPAKILEYFPDYGAFLVDSAGKLSSLGKPFALRPWPQTGP